MLESLLLLALSAAINGAVIYGVVKTELRYLRRDVTRAQATADAAHRALHSHRVAHK